jgi:hypothetical protein
MQIIAPNGQGLMNIFRQRMFKIMRAFLITLTGMAAILITSCSPKENKMTFVDTKDSEFKVGQVWNYTTRAAEANSTLTICKIEVAGKLGKVIHVSIADVKAKSAQNKDGFATTINHLPFAEPAIKQSVSNLVKEGVALPNYREGYDSWRKAVFGRLRLPKQSLLWNRF